MIRYLIPATLTNICVFLLSIIDGIFVGNGVGTNALGAVNIVYPFIWINYGINVLTTIGGVTIVAIRLGRGDVKGANEAFFHSVIFTLFTSTIVSFCGVVFTTPMARLLGASNSYISLVREYLFWYCIFVIPGALSTNLQHFCRNDGDPTLVGVCSVVSTITNIVLDYLFVFPLQMGIMGAALATGLSHTLSLLIILSHYFRQKGNLRLRPVPIQPVLFKKIARRGLPDMIAQFSAPVTIYSMNYVLASDMGNLGINTYAIINYVASFAMSIMYGVSEGLQPLIGRSYGAKQVSDLKFYFHIGLVIAFIGSAVFVIITDIYSREICELFGTDLETTISTAVNMPKYSWAFIIAGVNALISAYLFSTKRSEAATVYNVLRCLVLNTLCIFLLPVIFGQSIIWYSYGISEIFVLIIGFIIIFITERNGLIRN